MFLEVMESVCQLQIGCNNATTCFLEFMSLLKVERLLLYDYATRIIETFQCIKQVWYILSVREGIKNWRRKEGKFVLELLFARGEAQG